MYYVQLEQIHSSMPAYLKLVSAIFIKFLFFRRMIALQKLRNYFLFHLKSSFRSRDIQNFVFLPFLFFYLSAIALEDDRRYILKFMTPSIV